jgi:hypothetical protein
MCISFFIKKNLNDTKDNFKFLKRLIFNIFILKLYKEIYNKIYNKIYNNIYSNLTTLKKDNNDNKDHNDTNITFWCR